MDKDELLEIIDNAVRENLTELNLSYNQLTQLPREIWQLTKLTGLKVRGI